MAEKKRVATIACTIRREVKPRNLWHYEIQQTISTECTYESPEELERKSTNLRRMVESVVDEGIASNARRA